MTWFHKHVTSPHSLASETIPSDIPVTSVEPAASAKTLSTRRITLKRPLNPVDRTEHPKRTRSDDDESSALLSAYHHGLAKVSENLKNGNNIFSRTGMPDMAIKIGTDTQTVKATTNVQSVEHLQKDIENLLFTVSFSAAVPILKQPSMSWSYGDVQK